jgi:hypothetical protein
MAWITAPLNAGPIIGSSFNYTIPGLSANTIYEYRAYMIVGGIEYFGQTYQINTLPPTQVPPTVITGVASITSPYEVHINNNNLVSGGTKPIISRGIVWSTSPNPTIPSVYGNVDSFQTLGLYSLVMANDDYPTLEPNTTYYVRAFAESYNINGGFTSYGDQIVVQTTALPPTMTETYNQGTPGALRFQYFVVGDSILPGDIFSLTVYSHTVAVTAVSGDGPLAIITKLRDAINATTAVQWNDHGSAPATGTPGFKPSANLAILGVTLVVTLNYQNQFGYSATRP